MTTPLEAHLLFDSMEDAVVAVFDEVARQAAQGGTGWEVVLLVPRRILPDESKVQLIGFTSFTRFESWVEEIRLQFVWAVNRFARVVGATRALKVEAHPDRVEVLMECADGANSVVYVARREPDGRLGPFVVDRPNPEGWFVPTHDAEEPGWGRAGVDLPLLWNVGSCRYADLLEDDEEDETDED